MKPLIVLSLFLVPWHLDAQNLVPNPSFEYYTPWWCGYAIDVAEPWGKPNGSSVDLWMDCQQKTPQHSHNCPTVFMSRFYGHQRPRTGSAMIGFRSWCGKDINLLDPDEEYREMFSVKLLSPLVAKQVYSIRFAISASEASTHFSDDFGVYFSNTFVYGDNLVMTSLKPQAVHLKGLFITDTEKWDSISLEYTAQGGEQYMIIGNFKKRDETSVIENTHFPDTFTKHFGSTTYYFVDDVTVEECNGLPPPVLSYSHDTLSTLPGYKYRWYTNKGQLLPDTGHFIITEKPGEYVVCMSNDEGCTRVRHFNIPLYPCTDIELYPNPATEVIRIRTPYNDFTRVTVYNALGQLVLDESYSAEYDHIVNTRGSLAPGLYIVIAETRNCRLKEKVIIRGD